MCNWLGNMFSVNIYVYSIQYFTWCVASSIDTYCSSLKPVLAQEPTFPLRRLKLETPVFRYCHGLTGECLLQNRFQEPTVGHNPWFLAPNLHFLKSKLSHWPLVKTAVMYIYNGDPLEG